MEEDEYPMPTGLNDCFTVIGMMMDSSEENEREWFKKTNEAEVLSNVHHGFGGQLRNMWGLWNKNSVMYKYFSKMGLWHAEDMSSVILTSYHRHINGKELELKNQIQYYVDYWSEYEKDNGPVGK